MRVMFHLPPLPQHLLEVFPQVRMMGALVAFFRLPIGVLIISARLGHSRPEVILFYRLQLFAAGWAYYSTDDDKVAA